MKLIFAQGNPGATYDNTRHNIGFAVLDSITSTLQLSFTEKTKFQALFTETTIDGEKIIFAKPTTFYNETGIAARTIADFYKLDTAKDILVVHDELALPFGTIKTRQEGSDAGNNGIKSLNQHLGPRYARIRIGIYNPLRDQINDADFVLGKFTSEEAKALPLIVNQTNIYIDRFIAGELAPTRTSIVL
ncbi:MAG TPA: aminoacyl-tRNA hydrolase [Candidatus Saccharimonadales bacterium]|nr:aminoacyl-tRNA hydrolase [Candidatus Saccharimonadales bacterium]